MTVDDGQVRVLLPAGHKNGNNGQVQVLLLPPPHEKVDDGQVRVLLFAHNDKVWVRVFLIFRRDKVDDGQVRVLLLASHDNTDNGRVQVLLPA